ncbi:hypothetical protein N7474_003714 [Penicillium riverlandense]|uniref:uncharacterized protein n=1 Tax=Penicillium riverlandense TaxID=1903569 RepID=UPI0025495D46|nr:uncharacterized protein N7474_003714 [Penicillium riverlandense]KAJ5818123.1 hypothetical protein N7474_003714 [Penicillium riverlandense]
MNAPPVLGHPAGVSLAPPERQGSPQSPVNLGSNNPFRNRALSPSVSSATSNTRPERPRSTNPFLDETETLSPQSAPGLSSETMFSPVEKTNMTGNTRELFENLSLKETIPASAAASATTAPQQNGTRPAPAAPQPTPRRPSARRPPPRDRPSGHAADPRSKDPLDIFADPPTLSKSATTGPGRGERPRRPRRNSESSVMERASQLFDDDDEKRRRERRHRERDARHRDGKQRSSRKNRRLDIIDKLDVTGIYGTGMFHHDGPFDACNPHRNRKGARTAPMQAFPKDSRNMALGGAGPNNSNIDLNLFHGSTPEGYNDFARGAVTAPPPRRTNEPITFDPTTNLDPIHGSESMGLGTSTFLDGAPASRSAIARRQSENENQIVQNGGLQRKKSLAQRIRGRTTGAVGRVASPTDPTFAAQAPGSSHSTASRNNERNPYFQDHDEAGDKTRVHELEVSGGRVRSSSSPKQSTGLERKSTNDRSNTGGDESKLNPGGGFLNRMKSLRKPRPERRTSE